MYLFMGALFGFVSVAFGAYAEHGLREVVSEQQWSSLMTAIRYNQIYAALISSMGLLLLAKVKLAHLAILKISCVLFIVGSYIFCFSVYLSVLLDIAALTMVTPFGGVCIMLAWLSLLCFAVLQSRASSNEL